MKPNPKFLMQEKHFWANVRTISQQVGYTVRSGRRRAELEDDVIMLTGPIKVPQLPEIIDALRQRGLTASHIADPDGNSTEFGTTLQDYFQYRADVLNNHVHDFLMDAKEARVEFLELLDTLNPTCPLPMNKQKGEKKSEAYFTCIVNMLVESNAEGMKCDYDPRELTTVTRGGAPLRTLARRVDGAFPSPVNPIAVWEIKEYYYTKTFGSRVADGVYESLLDGLELEELRDHENIDVKHYLMVDSHFTWWVCGRSYLCRIIDMLHMGYVDEVLFGREVLTELPRLVKEWVAEAHRRE